MTTRLTSLPRFTAVQRCPVVAVRVLWHAVQSLRVSLRAWRRYGPRRLGRGRHATFGRRTRRGVRDDPPGCAWTRGQGHLDPHFFYGLTAPRFESRLPLAQLSRRDRIRRRLYEESSEYFEQVLGSSSTCMTWECPMRISSRGTCSVSRINAVADFGSSIYEDMLRSDTQKTVARFCIPPQK